MNRDTDLLAIRPSLDLDGECHSHIERFQNLTLRPILKLQHHMTLTLLDLSKNWRKLTEKIDNRESYIQMIEKYFTKDISLRNQILGSIIGMMTIEEIEIYKVDSSIYNKRIISMQVQRFADTVYPMER